MLFLFVQVFLYLFFLLVQLFDENILFTPERHTTAHKKSPATNSTRRGAMSYRENVRKGLRSNTVVVEQPEKHIRQWIEEAVDMLHRRSDVGQGRFLVIAASSGGDEG